MADNALQDGGLRRDIEVSRVHQAIKAVLNSPAKRKEPKGHQVAESMGGLAVHVEGSQIVDLQVGLVEPVNKPCDVVVVASVAVAFPIERNRLQSVERSVCPELSRLIGADEVRGAAEEESVERNPLLQELLVLLR